MALFIFVAVLGVPALRGFRRRLNAPRDLAQSWPNAARINRAGLFALIALSLPYVCSFSYLPYELASPGGDAGQGVGLLLFLVVTTVAGVLGAVGWFTGLRSAPHPGA